MGMMSQITGACWVVVENGDMLLYGPKGEILTCQEGITATANCSDGLATCTVSFVCNIAASKEEMLDKIARWKKDGERNIQNKEWTEKRVAEVRKALGKKRVIDCIKALFGK